MHKFYNTAFKSVLLAGICCFGPTAAYAFGGYITGINPGALSPVVSAVDGTTSAVNATNANLKASTAELIATLTDMNGQNVEDSEVIAKQNTTNFGQLDTDDVKLHVQQFGLNAIDQAQSGTSACNVITGAMVGAAINQASTQYQQQGTNAEIQWMNGGSKANPAPSFTGLTAAQNALISAHCQNAATQADIDSGLCPKGTKIQPESTQPGGAGVVANDVNNDQNAGVLFDQPIPQLNKVQQNIAGNMMAMIFTPQPFGAMPPGSAQSAAGRIEAYNRMTTIAQASAPYAISMGILANEQPLSGGKDTTNQSTATQSGGDSVSGGTSTLSGWASATLEQVPSYENPPSGGWFPDGVSEDAWLWVRAVGWFLNPNWATSLNGDSETQAVKDLTMIESYRAYLQYKQYRLQEQDTFLLAELVAHADKPTNSQ